MNEHEQFSLQVTCWYQVHALVLRGRIRATIGLSLLFSTPFLYILIRTGTQTGHASKERPWSDGVAESISLSLHKHVCLLNHIDVGVILSSQNACDHALPSIFDVSSLVNTTAFIPNIREQTVPIKQGERINIGVQCEGDRVTTTLSIQRRQEIQRKGETKKRSNKEKGRNKEGIHGKYAARNFWKKNEIYWILSIIAMSSALNSKSFHSASKSPHIWSK